MTLPSSSGLDLTATTPVGPQTRVVDEFVLIPPRERLRFWHRYSEYPDLNVEMGAEPAFWLADEDSSALRTNDYSYVEVT